LIRTVFSHIVQKRLSQENENVATEALAFILQSSDAAKAGLLKLLRGINPELPNLWFRTQQTEGGTRPDMWGLDATASPYVFIENKFWAGLTDNQPVAYLNKLSERPHSSVLLFVVPPSREKSVWRELMKRLNEADIGYHTLPSTSGSNSIVKTSLGPQLAITTWKTLLAFLDAETVEDVTARNDLTQLRALCEEAESSAFVPFSRESISDQQTPNLILQLTGLVHDVSSLAFDEGVLFRERLTPQANTERIGRYASILPDQRCGVWLGVHFTLWNEHGNSPFWVIFSSTDWGRAHEVRALLEPWSAQSKVFVTDLVGDHFAVSIDLPCGEEKPLVVRSIVDQLAAIGKVLDPLPPRESKMQPDVKEE
jgi:hypothetical protein